VVDSWVQSVVFGCARLAGAAEKPGVRERSCMGACLGWKHNLIDAI
jgi:hypothetical protein